MTERTPPHLGDYDEPEKKEKIKVSREEARKWLTKHRPRLKVPYSKRAIKRAKSRIRRRERNQARPKGKEISFSSPEAPFQVIYGTTRVGGAITFLQQSAGDSWLNHVITYACHEVEQVDYLYLDENRVDFSGGIGGDRWATGGTRPDGSSIDYTNKVFLASDNDGAVGQSVQGDLNTQLPLLWTSNHKQDNRAHIYLILVWDADLFANGQPEILLQVQGAKVYDPRDTNTVYSANASLCLADFLTNDVYGLGYDYTDLDTSTSVGGLQWAADRCDDAVALKAGGTESRYETNGAFDVSESPDNIIEALESAMGGYLTYSEGKFKFWPGYYTAPSVTLTDDDLRSEIKISTLISSRDNFNSVRGNYSSSRNDYEVTDFPAHEDSGYVTEDGSVTTWEDVSLPFTTSATMAQRIARIELERIRRSITIAASWSLKALQLEPGDTVSLTISRYGWSSKVFEVHDFEFSITNGEPFVDLLLREVDSNVYAWTPATDERDMVESPTTDLPDPFTVTAPTGLTLASGTDNLYTRKDGTIFTRIKVSWTAPSDVYVTTGGHFEIQYKQSADSDYYQAAIVDGSHTFMYILDVEDGEDYDVRIRSVSALGVKSSWVTETSHTVEGKTAAPTDMSSLSAVVKTNGILISWDAIGDLDKRAAEIRYGSAWDTGTTIFKGDALSYLWQHQTAASYSFYGKWVDNTGNYSSGTASTTLTIGAPNTVQNYTVKAVDNQVLIDWTTPAAGDLPIDYYNVYKGATFGAASLIGRVTGTFAVYIEDIGDEYKYWVTAVDTAGNESAETGSSVLVYNPPDFILNLEQYLDPANFSASSNAVDEGDGSSFTVSLDTSETWATHFTSNSWADIGDQIAAGYDYYGQPTQTTGSATWEVDVGEVVSESMISLTYLENAVDGAVTETVTLSYKENPGDSWTDGASGATQVFGKNFQYIKVHFAFSGGDDTAISTFSQVYLKVDVKKQTDSGNGTSSASAATTVSFNLDYLDITALNVTPSKSTTPSSSDRYHTIIEFDWSTSNPTSFDVLIYDYNGNQVAVDFGWTAEGFIDVVS